LTQCFAKTSLLCDANLLYLIYIYPDFKENTIVMDENEPSSVQAQEKKEKARAE